jgi:hypothetical protein
MDPACNAGGSLSLSDGELSRHNCLGTDQTGDKTGLSYYCGQAFDQRINDYRDDVGLCCPTGEEPRYISVDSIWRCSPTDPCYPAPRECDFDFETQFTSWIGDTKSDGDPSLWCVAPSEGRACCEVVQFGEEEYWSNNPGNVKVY